MKKLKYSLIAVALMIFTTHNCEAQPELISKAIFAHSLRNYDEAEQYYKEALQHAISKSDSNEEILAYKGLGTLAVNRGDSARAAENFKKAVELESAAPNTSATLKSATLMNLASAYRRSGRLAETELLLKKALALSKESNDEKSEALVEDHLSALYRAQGRFADAEAASLKSYNLAKKSFGTENGYTTSIMANRGTILGLQGRYRDAEEILKSAISLDEKLKGTNECLTAAASADLAKIYLTQGKLKEAQALYLRSIELRSKICGQDDPEVAKTKCWLARAYLEDGKISQAKDLAEAALSAVEKQSGQNSSASWLELTVLASVYEKQGDLAKALELSNRALQISKNHKTLLQKASVLRSQGKLKESEEYARAALKNCQAVFGAEHPQVAKCLMELAKTLNAQQSFQESRLLEKRAKLIKEKVDKLNLTRR